MIGIKLITMTILVTIPTISNSKEFLSGRVEEPSSFEQYEFNRDTLTNSCNKLKSKLGNDKVTLSTKNKKQFYNRHDNECIVEIYPGRYKKYQNTKFGTTNNYLNQ